MSLPLWSIDQLAILSDVHIGSAEHREKEFGETIEHLSRHKIPTFLNGDIVENVFAGLGRADNEMLAGQTMNPTEQFKTALAVLKPLIRRKLILGVTEGNHEARTVKRGGLDQADLFAHALEVPYYRIGGMFRIKAGRQLYTIAIQHGSSFAKNPLLELRRMRDLYAEAELYALGHNHHLSADRDLHLGVDKRGVEVPKEKWLVRTGSYTEYPPYCRTKMAAPHPIGSPILSFSSDDHEIYVDTETLRWM